MKDWLDSLNEGERKDWDQFVRGCIEDLVPKMSGSAMVMTLVSGKPDIKFAVELGMAIMLDKPILALALPGSEVPARLRRAADMVLECDPTTESGQRELTAAIEAFATGAGEDQS